MALIAFLHCCCRCLSSSSLFILAHAPSTLCTHWLLSFCYYYYFFDDCKVHRGTFKAIWHWRV